MTNSYLCLPSLHPLDPYLQYEPLDSYDRQVL